MKIYDLIKTSKPGAPQPYAFLPYVNERPKICTTKTLIHYLDRTKNYRNNTKNLLLTIKKPFRAATSQSISRWLRSVLEICKIDGQYTGHSTRHASTSNAFKKGININIIKKAAGWSANSNVFSKFYNRPIEYVDKHFAQNLIVTED